MSGDPRSGSEVSLSIPRIFSGAAAPPLAAPVWPRWSLILVAAIAGVDLCWLALTDLSLSLEGATGPVNGLLFAAVIALILRRAAFPPRFHMLLAGLALMLAAWPVLRIYNHLAMTLPVPLADPWLSAADRALGFDWLAYALWVDGQPLLIRLMSLAYSGLTAYSIVTFVLILIMIGAERAREFVLLFLMTAIAASTLGMIFPADAAMTYYSPSPDLFRFISDRTGTYHIEIMRSLRGDPAYALPLAHLPGLTTFPSFHTAMGFLCIWCARGSVWLFIPVAIVNVLMIASTPVIGSHYLVDVIGGLTLGAAAVCLLHRLRHTLPPMRLPASGRQPLDQEGLHALP